MRGKVLKVATYNIEFSRRPQLLLKILSEMARNGVNIFCLQEILKIPNIEFIVDFLLKNLGKSWKLEYLIGEEGNYADEGVGILWNTKVLKLKSIDRIHLPKIKKYSALEVLLLKAANFVDKPLQQRAITAEFLWQNHILRVSSIHLDALGGIKHREKQTKYFLEYLKNKSNVTYEVICGDFNTLDTLKTGKEPQKMRDLFREYSFTDATKNIEWSADIYNSNLGEKSSLLKKLIKTFNIHIKRKLDYIWCKGLRISEAKRLNEIGSDHYPLTATLFVL